MNKWRKFMPSYLLSRPFNSLLKENVVEHSPLKEKGKDEQQFRRVNHNYSLLESGLRVATQPATVPGKFCTVGVAISAGCRNEARYPPGTARFIQKLAFASSENFPDRSKVEELMDQCEAIVDCQHTRDTFLYASSCRTSKAHEVVKLLADAILRPKILEDEISVCRDTISFENEEMARNPDPNELLADLIHQAAFRQNTVGLPFYCPSDLANNVSSKHILSFQSQYFTPPRMALAGVGIDHHFLADIGKELFNPSESSWAKSPDKLLANVPDLDDSLAQYTGGEIRVQKDLSQMALGLTDYPNLAHLMIGFQAVGINHEDFVPFCVLQMLMGGGSSFSAGGPGKGMYTRLYTEVLNQHHWVFNATAFNHYYIDSGLFCVRASADPLMMGLLAKIIISEFRTLTKGVNKEELARAKTQLKSQLLMNLEVRPVQFEDLVRQILVHGKKKSAEEYCELIDQVQNEDIIRIARTMLNSRVSFVGYGDLKHVPTYEQLQTML